MATIRRCTALLASTLLWGLLLLPLEAQPAAAQTVPDDLRLDTLMTGLFDPTSFAFGPDGRIYLGQRDGKVLIRDVDGTVTQAGQLPVNGWVCPTCAEQVNDDGGLMALQLDRDFATTRRIIVSYNPAFTMTLTNPRFPGRPLEQLRLSTFALRPDDTLDLASEEVLATEWIWWGGLESNGNHYGADIAWMEDGTLLWSVGDDTSPRVSSGYAPTDNRPTFEWNNALLTAQNPSNLLGKVLRLMPDGSAPDGTQTRVLPDGTEVPIAANPYVHDGTYDARIYALGFRSPFRLVIEPRTQAVVVGNVGPDAGSANPSRGPAGIDEIDVIPPGGGGNYGWPMCIGANVPYRQYNWLTSESGPAYDCSRMRPAAYHYGRGSRAFPTLVGAAPMPVAHYPAGHDGPFALPERFHDKLIHVDWSSGRLYTIPFTPEGELVVAPDAPVDTTIRFNHPIDANVGPDGALYLLDYGSNGVGGFWGNTNGRLLRLTCAGCEAVDGAQPALASVQPRHAGVPGSSPGGRGTATVLVLLAVAATATRLRLRRTPA